MAHSEKQEIGKRAKRPKATKQIAPGVIKGMANALRVQVLTILNERAASATEISKELGVLFDRVSYEMKVLKESDLIEEVAQKRSRGAVERFYRAKARAMLDGSEWPKLPGTIKGNLRATLLKTLMDDAIEAIDEETYDSRDDAHMSWTPLIVDDRGCEELAEILERALDEVLEVQANSADRLVTRDVEGLSYTVSILGYPSAHKARKVGPPIDATKLAKSTEPREAEKSTKRSRASGAKRGGPVKKRNERKGNK